MEKNKKIEQKVNKAFQELENPTRFEGTSFFHRRVMAGLRQETLGSGSPNLQKISGWAAVIMVLINISLLTSQFPGTATDSENNIDLLLEKYELVPASSWENYFALDDINAIEFKNEER